MKNIFWILLSATVILPGCVSYEDLVNFNEGPVFPDSLQNIDNLPDLVIQPDDLLSIRVRVLDMEAAAPFNIDPEGVRNIGGQGIENTRALMGYLVNKDGYIDFPQLGSIEAAGKTTRELKEQIQKQLEPYLIDPTVIVRLFNFRITVLGEVNRPGTYNIATERVTILDALSEAGDLTVYANRNNVLLVREQKGQREYVRLNLQDRSIFESPYFYLLQNDLIYVEPEEAKTATIRDQSQRIAPWVSVVSSTISLIIAIISLSQ